MAARAGLVVVAAAAVMVALLAGGAYADCFETCFSNCIANDKSMVDYCNYACGMTCGGGDGGTNVAIGSTIHCQIACVRESCRPLRADGMDMEACYGQCYDGCKTKASLPSPLGAGAAGAVPVRPPALPDHPFHKMPEAVKPTSEPDPDDVGRRASGPLLP